MSNVRWSLPGRRGIRISITAHPLLLLTKLDTGIPLFMSTDSPDIVPPRSQPISEVLASTGEGKIVPPTSASSTHDTTIPDFFNPGHIVQIPLRTHQDVGQARSWLKPLSSQTRPVLSDLEFTFRGLHDSADGTTTIRIVRVPHHHKPGADPEAELAIYLGIHDHDFSIPSRTLRMYNEVTKDGGVWIARFWTADSKDLVGDHLVLRWYYAFFRDLALRKEGKDWDSGDLASIIEFLADLRGR